MKIIKMVLKVLIVALVLIIGCKDSGTDPAENIVIPESNVNFNEHIYPLFSAKCSSRIGCHAISSPAAGLVLIDYNDITTHFMRNVPSEQLIRTGSGEDSPLYQVLIQDGFFGVPRMPFNGPYLNSNQTDGVKTWIDEGANP